MRQALYLEDSYQKEMEATVTKADGKYIVLDTTVFYPASGGQPHDTGTLLRSDGKKFAVVFVGMFDGQISHEVDQEGLKEGDRVKGMIEWEPRYTLMRMHTAAHVIIEFFRRTFGALVTGNQLGTEISRIDFNMETFDADKLKDYEKKINHILQKNMDVSFSFISGEEAKKDPELFKLAKGYKERDEMRVVTIGDWDRQADGGCHVKNTKEVGTIRFVDFKNKGKNNRRVYYSLN